MNSENFFEKNKKERAVREWGNDDYIEMAKDLGLPTDKLSIDEIKVCLGEHEAVLSKTDEEIDAIFKKAGIVNGKAEFIKKILKD